MIRAHTLSKRFGRLHAVRDLSFEVAAGEVLGFLGPNGAGKSTTLRILSGWWPPTSGAASIDGFDLTRDSLRARGRVGYLPEGFSAPPELRVGEYLRFRAGLKGLGSRGRRRVAELADLLGLQQRLRQTVGTLSRGFRQRVGLADALLADPPALLLDEPFGGLDPLQRQDFRELLRRLARDGKAVLFSSHVLPEVEDLADRVLILHHGEARAAGTWLELVQTARADSPLRLVTAGDPDSLQQALGAASPLATRCPLVRREGLALILQPADAQARDQLFRWLADRGEPITEFRLLTPSLELLFRRLVEDGTTELGGRA